MSNTHGPQINTTGLVLYIDAGNTKSFPGSGTNWADLSAIKNNGTLSGNPATFNGDGGGSLYFDGGVTTTFSHVSAYDVTGVTVLMFIKTPVAYTSNFRGFFSKFGADRDFNFYAYSTGGAGIIDCLHMFSHRISGYTSVVTVPNGALTLDKWYQLGFSIGESAMTFYYNGTILYSGAYSGYFNANNSYDIHVSSADNYWLGRISSTMMYNRVLSINEVSQNYNAVKTRYGL